MIKLTFCVHRLNELAEADFHHYWQYEHGPLVLSFAEVLGIRRYVQSHRIDSPVNDTLRASRDTIEPYDGTAELWWDSIDALAAGTATDEGRAASVALLEDEKRFIDLPRCTLWLSDEVVIVG